MAREDAGEERAVAAADIDDAAEGRKVIGRGYGDGGVLGEIGHGGIEVGGFVRMLRQSCIAPRSHQTGSAVVAHRATMERGGDRRARHLRLVEA